MVPRRPKRCGCAAWERRRPALPCRYRIKATVTSTVDTAPTSAASATTSSAGTTVTTALAASADSYVRDGTYASTNFGSDATVATKKAAANSGFNRNIFLTYATSSVTGTLDSAKVRLYGNNNGGSDTNVVVNIYAVTSPSWTESGLTWNNQPTAGTTVLTTATVTDNTSRYYEWDVTSYVNAERAAGRNTVGFMVQVSAATSTSVPTFNSKEAASNQPSLTVTQAVNAAPTIATAAGASPSTVTGTTTALSVLGADDGGESNLTYTWSATTVPTGAPAPDFSINGTNAAKNATVTFHKAGTYAFVATISDGTNAVASATVSVTVSQTLDLVLVDQQGAAVVNGGTQSFSATAYDQFGLALATQPTFTWTVSGSIGGTFSGSTYTAPSSGTGTVQVYAATGGLYSPPADVEVGKIAGNVFNDQNSNGSLDAIDWGLGAVRVYLDDNNDGTWQTTESSTFTDENGNYAFGSAGSAMCGHIRAAGDVTWTQTTPGGDGSQNVNLFGGDTLGGVVFAFNAGTTGKKLVAKSGDNDQSVKAIAKGVTAPIFISGEDATGQAVDVSTLQVEIAYQGAPPPGGPTLALSLARRPRTPATLYKSASPSIRCRTPGITLSF